MLLEAARFAIDVSLCCRTVSNLQYVLFYHSVDIRIHCLAETVVCVPSVLWYCIWPVKTKRHPRPILCWRER